MALVQLLGLPPAVWVTISNVLGAGYVTIVLAFGTLWVLMNVYQYYPLLRALVALPIERSWSTHRFAPLEPVANGGGFPTIDLLLPAYDEAGVIEQAIRSVHEADYPDDRLQLHVLTEPDDESTRERLHELTDRFDFSMYRIPAGYPHQPNKPRALNFGYSVTDAELVGVIDAEDVVADDLFRRVASAFGEGCDYALARLDMANESDGWLNLLFRAEYGFWYEYLVPAFTRAGYPIPLGGTSCFFRRDVLVSIAERRVERYGWPWTLSQRLWLAERGLLEPVPWDAETVTEDFELGLFLWEDGYVFEYLDTVTAEESPVSLDGWLDQRVRWQKGKLQTLSKALRQPPRGVRRKAHVWWQSALPHLGPVNVVGVGLIFWLATIIGVVPDSTVRLVLQVGLAFLVVTSLLFVAGYWTASTAPTGPRLRRATIVGGTVFFYWLFQWLADVRALIDMHRGRFEWTPSHHLGRHVGTATVAAAAYVGRPARRAELSTRQLTTGLASILVIALGIRAFALDKWSLWHDEIYTITVRGAAPIAELVTMTSDPHPPLYYLLVRGWMSVVGQAPNAMRSLSILFSLGTVVAVFLLGRSVYDDRTGLLAALIVAVSTLHVHFGRTVRMYGLFTMLAALSWYFYVDLRTDGRCFSWLPRAWLGRSLGYLLVSTALLYTHVYGLFVIASQHLVEGLSERGRVDRRVWWSLQAALGVLFLPWAAVLAGQLVELTRARGASPIAWIPEPSMGLLRETILLFGGFPSIYPILSGSPTALAATTVSLFVMSVAVAMSIVTWDAPPDRTYYFVDGRQAAMLGLFAAGLFIPFVLSYVFVPVFVPRYAIAASLPLAVLVSRGLLNVPETWWRRGLVGVLLLSAIVTTGLYYSSDTAADWRAVADHLTTEAQPGDLVVFQPTWIREDVDYYAPTLAADRYALRSDGRLAPGDIDRLRTLMASHDTVWLVRHTGTDTQRSLELLRDERRLVEVIDGGVVRLYRFE